MIGHPFLWMKEPFALSTSRESMNLIQVDGFTGFAVTVVEGCRTIREDESDLS